ncbi:MAG: SMP-30/gluconolactonase/LRE family protein, partial [Pseudomonadales bacterium]
GGFQWHRGRDGRRFPGEQAADYSGGRIERINLETGSVDVLFDACDGERLKGPNDLVFDETGGFWFTDHG